MVHRGGEKKEAKKSFCFCFDPNNSLFLRACPKSLITETTRASKQREDILRTKTGVCMVVVVVVVVLFVCCGGCVVCFVVVVLFVLLIVVVFFFLFEKMRSFFICNGYRFESIYYDSLEILFIFLSFIKICLSYMIQVI